jgi:hypothetical protein
VGTLSSSADAGGGAGGSAGGGASDGAGASRDDGGDGNAGFSSAVAKDKCVFNLATHLLRHYSTVNYILLRNGSLVSRTLRGDVVVKEEKGSLLSALCSATRRLVNNLRNFDIICIEIMMKCLAATIPLRKETKRFLAVVSVVKHGTASILARKDQSLT